MTAPAVALSIADFLVRTEMERLRLLRLYLRATVRLASPLLLELAFMEQIRLEDAVALIHPPQDWPWRPLDDRQPPGLQRLLRRKGSLASVRRSEVQAFRRHFANPGVVVRDADHPRGRFAIRPHGAVLGFTADVGPCMLSAYGSSAMIKFPDPLPEALLAAMPGRPIGAIIDHPMFADPNFKIRRVQPDLADGLPVLLFRAPLVAFEMPGAVARS